jgi:GGDEF domain-containing protein
MFPKIRNEELVVKSKTENGQEITNIDYTGYPEISHDEGRKRVILKVEQAKNQGKQIILVFSDLDNFKNVNDKTGNQKGNEAITTTVQQKKRNFRS